MSTDTNVCVLNGRLTRDVEIRQAGATEVLGMRLAVNGRRKVGDAWQDAPSFFDVSHFPRSTRLAEFLVKGKMISVVGRLQQREYVTKEGDRRSVVEIVASEVQLLGGVGDVPTPGDPVMGASREVAGNNPHRDDEIPF